MNTLELPQGLAEDLAFIRSFCPRFVPCHVAFDEKKGKHKKVQALPGWTQITSEKSQFQLHTHQVIQ